MELTGVGGRDEELGVEAMEEEVGEEARIRSFSFSFPFAFSSFLGKLLMMDFELFVLPILGIEVAWRTSPSSDPPFPPPSELFSMFLRFAYSFRRSRSH